MSEGFDMGMILLVIIFVLVNIHLIWLYKVVEKRMCTYDTMFCRDVRAQLGMFAYKSKVEETRDGLSRADSNF